MDHELKLDIWMGIAEKGSFVNKLKINNFEKEECERIDEYMRIKLLESGYSTISNSIRKTLYGYSVRRLCNQTQPCVAAWILKIHLNGEGTIYFNSKCNHVNF
jgi:hypothetical protein